MKYLVTLACAASAIAGSVASVQAGNDPWTGPYAGLQAGRTFTDGAHFSGGGFGNSISPATQNLASLLAQGATFSTDDLEAFSGGAQLGYNFRASRTVVVGLEADISFIRSDATGSERRFPNPADGLFPTVATTSASPLEYLGTVRGRLGYLVSDPLLVYATAGLAYGEADSSASVTLSSPGPGTVVVPGSAAFGDKSLRAGYTVGGGLEYFLEANWSLKAEGLYYDLGSSKDSTSITLRNGQGLFLSTTTIDKKQDNDGYVGRVGLNYHF